MSALIDTLRLVVVANDPLARTGLAALLSENSDYQVVGQIAADTDLARNLPVYSADVIVWDLGWEPANAIELLAEVNDINVLALLADETYASDAWVAGAHGLFLRSTSIKLVVGGVPAVARGLIVIDPALGRALLSPRARAIPEPTTDLTTREMQVLQYLAQGVANKTIAQRLNISESTVKFHVNAIMGKLNAQSRTDAVVRATRLGLIML